MTWLRWINPHFIEETTERLGKTTEQIPKRSHGLRETPELYSNATVDGWKAEILHQLIVLIGSLSRFWPGFWNLFYTSQVVQDWLVVSTHLKNISQIRSFPQVGVKIKNIWNHHLEDFFHQQYECNYICEREAATLKSRWP